MTTHNNFYLLGKAPIPVALLSLGLPTMLGMLINALYNLADTYFVSGLGTTPMAAVSVVYPLGQIVVGLGLLFGNGAAAYLSRLLGKGDHTTANTVASTSLYGSIGIGVLTICCTLLFLTPILQQLGALPAMLSDAQSYATIYVAFSIFNIFNVAMNNIVSSEGAAKTAMSVLAIGALLNVALDPLFIYTFKLGITGAALATAFSQMVSSILYIIYILRKKSTFHFHLKDCRFTTPILSEILKIGVPTLLFQLLTSLSIAMTNDAAKIYGDSAVAALGPVTKILAMGTLMVYGFLKGFQPIAGFSYGAKNYARLRKAVQIALLWSTLFCVVFGGLSLLFSKQLLSLFTATDATMLHIGQRALQLNALSFMLFGIYTVYSFLFLVLGKAKEGCFLGACRQGLCFVPLIWLLPNCFGLYGVLLAQPIADVLSFIITLCMAERLHCNLRAEEKAQPLKTPPHL